MMVSFSGGCVDLLTVNLELIVFFLYGPTFNHIWGPNVIGM
jgi:hypothetical protein